MFKTGLNHSTQIKTKIPDLLDRSAIIQSFQNGAESRSVFLNRLSGVRLSPGPPYFPRHRPCEARLRAILWHRRRAGDYCFVCAVGGSRPFKRRETASAA